MNGKKGFAALILASLGAGYASAQSPDLIKHTFQDNDGGWTGLGQTAKVSISHDTNIVKAGEGALRFDYDVAKGQFNALVLPAQIGSLTTAKSVKFQVRTDNTTLLVISLQEQDGGRYNAMFLAPKDKWQTVELSTSDFMLAQDKDDPKDPDGKLDLDKVNGVAIGDISQIFVLSDNAALTDLIGVKAGGHSLYIQDFSVSTDSLSASLSKDGEKVKIDGFNHPQLNWFGLGNARLSKASGKPLEGTALQADYHQAPGKFVAVTTFVAPGSLAGTTSLAFDVASLQPAKLVVQVEETDGGKYNVVIDVPGGSEVKHVSATFADFKAADDSKDENNKLDVEKIKTLLILDGSGMIDQADKDNTLWINQIVASK